MAPQSEPSPILVVDDEPGVRRLAARILRDAGHRVLQAADGLDALRLLATVPVALVLTDVQMPRMDGLRLAAAVREHFPAVPVLFMSAHPAGADSPARPLLTKPFDRAALLGEVAQQLGLA